MAKQSCNSTRSRSFGTDARLLVSLLRSSSGQRVDVRKHLASLVVGIAREDRRRNLDRTTLLFLRERLELRTAHQDRRCGTVAVCRAHGPRIGIRDHDVAHDLLEGHLLGVGRQGVQGRVRMVLARNLGKELEVGAAVLVAVLHADLGEDARHGVRTDPAVDARYGAVAPRARPRLAVALARATCQETGPGELLDAHREAHVGLHRP